MCTSKQTLGLAAVLSGAAPTCQPVSAFRMSLLEVDMMPRKSRRAREDDAATSAAQASKAAATMRCATRWRESPSFTCTAHTFAHRKPSSSSFSCCQ